MKKKRGFAIALALVACMAGIFYKWYSAQQSDKEEVDVEKVSVVYFSATGTTRKVAEMMAASIYSDIHEIRPTVPYTEADLNWRDSLSRSSLEMKDSTARPAIEDMPDFSDHDLIYLGYPIWWGVAPRIINTFIESQNLDSLQIVLFCTSGGSPAAPSMEALRRTYPNLRFEDALLLNNIDADGLISPDTTALEAQ
jgi:flavodoxin